MARPSACDSCCAAAFPGTATCPAEAPLTLGDARGAATGVWSPAAETLSAIPSCWAHPSCPPDEVAAAGCPPGSASTGADGGRMMCTGVALAAPVHNCCRPDPSAGLPPAAALAPSGAKMEAAPALPTTRVLAKDPRPLDSAAFLLPPSVPRAARRPVVLEATPVESESSSLAPRVPTAPGGATAAAIAAAFGGQTRPGEERRHPTAGEAATSASIAMVASARSLSAGLDSWRGSGPSSTAAISCSVVT